MMHQKELRQYASTNYVRNVNIPYPWYKLLPKVSLSSKHGMPIVGPYNGTIPVRLLSHHRSLQRKMYNYCLHFYEDDRHFQKMLYNYDSYMNYVSRYPYVISPDFSIHADYPEPLVSINSFYNKLFCACWQKEGLSVIPNVSWAKKESYDICFDGYPQNSVIAINSTGCVRDKRSKALWYSGYEEVMKRLNPKHIIRYGAKQDGEMESISTYFSNDNQNLHIWEEMDLFQK